MNYYYISIPPSSLKLTNADRVFFTSIGLFSLIVILVLVFWGLDIPGQIDNRKYERNRDEQQILSAIANACEKTADIFQPGATVADIVVATNLPVSRVLRIVKQFKRDEIVKEGLK